MIISPPAPLQCRDPFSGDCDLMRYPRSHSQPYGEACSAETRFQGIATKDIYHQKTGLLQTCSAETRFQGIATSSPPRRTRRCPKTRLQCRDPFSGDCDFVKQNSNRCWNKGSCSAETRFQGIATLHGPGFPITAPSGACSAETRFQGIATSNWASSSRSSPGRLAVPRPVFRGL